MITAVDLLAGIASFIGWDRLDVPNQSSYHDTDYQAAGRWAVDALSRYDVVCVHIEAPDESSHAADAATKVASLEAIDRYIVAPIAEALRRLGEHRLLLLPDHYTLVSNRKHHAEPVPFLIAGTGVAANGEREGFSEAHAQATGLSLPGHELIPRLRAASPA
jgi:2,3-bisphosphoglycerate-independent phosphoglycerate mutase